MGTYFPPLNLSLDADERAVRRAYAAALKRTRPDDDPVAFQALVAARDRALDWVRRRGAVAMAAAFDELTPAEADEEAGEADVEGGAPVGSGAVAIRVESSDGEIGERLDEATRPDAEEATPLVFDVVSELPPTDTGSPIHILHDSVDKDVRHGSGAPTLPPLQSFAAMIRSQHAARHVLSEMALKLLRDEADGDVPEASGATLPDRWAALLLTAEELDLSGRMMLERTIVVELDGILQQQANADTGQPNAFAGTILALDRGFRWSQDLRRVVRILGEPSGIHPLVFAIERFGENAVRLRMSPNGFPLIPDSDLAAWFGGSDNASVRAYRKAETRERFGFGWSWYAFLSPPAWCVRTGLSPWGIGFAALAIVAVCVLFDPIADVGTANGFVTFLFTLTAARVAAAVSARSLETAKLVRTITRIEAGPLPPLGERRRLIAAARGSKLLNVIVGLFFLLMVDGYCLTLIIPALNLRPTLVAGMIVVPDRKTPQVTFADRLVAQSYLDHAWQLAEEIDDLLRAETIEPINPLRRRQAETLQKNFLSFLKVLPIGDYATEFETFHQEVARLKRP